MRVDLAYGDGVLPIDLAMDADVIEPRDPPRIDEPSQALREALRRPIASPSLADLVPSDGSIVVVISDSTRPAPNRLMLEALLGELGAHVAGRMDVLVATGLHRPTRVDELDRMLGSELRRQLRVTNHDAHDESSLREIGRTSSGRPVLINRRYLDADVRITLGLIEPHFFAGFSGGAKLILPGVAGAASILRNHDAEMIGNPNARWGNLVGNPIHREQREAARLAGCEFCVNVTIAGDGAITGIFAGELEGAHDAGCQAALQAAMQPVDEPYDVVITTNGGHPLDLNLYQAVKGMDAAAQIVRPGGHIVMAAECREGAGHGDFVHILREHQTPDAMVRSIQNAPRVRGDQWQNQIFGRVLASATVHLRADGLTDDEIHAAHCVPCPDVARRTHELVGDSGRACVLPRGPFTIPYIAA
ncbi:MAG: nickel-dependent lactate racemase [Chloroflexota bacterium]|nr:nickel-dependent lactate racemase [Chloroflexota bacterium]MDE2898287.1 nickel-dependent lactate racemase [Chloroflexota bacterium]